MYMAFQDTQDQDEEILGLIHDCAPMGMSNPMEDHPNHLQVVHPPDLTTRLLPSWPSCSNLRRKLNYLIRLKDPQAHPWNCRNQMNRWA